VGTAADFLQSSTIPQDVPSCAVIGISLTLDRIVQRAQKDP
jgi:hypothetical protein